MCAMLEYECETNSKERVGNSTTQKIQKPDYFRGFESGRKFKALFDEFIAVFLKELFGTTCFRPLPPLIGLGQEVDLFELYTVVRKRGGYNTVSKNGSWSLVAQDCGFDLKFGSAFKLVYVKYLDILDRWLRKIPYNHKLAEDFKAKGGYTGFSGLFMELDSDLKVFLSDNVEKTEFDFVGSKDDDKSVHEIGGENVKVDKGGGKNVEVGKLSEGSVSGKRKRQCHLGMLRWIHKVAKDPWDGGIEPLPERHKWKSFGDEMEWNQILLARKEMLLRKKLDARSEYFWEKKLKMHPLMYGEDQSSSEQLRFSQRIRNDETITDVSTDDSDGSSSSSSSRRRRNSQADLPEISEEGRYVCDIKWLGTQIWPLETQVQENSLIEGDPIGKGRQESCTCRSPGSANCVIFHVREQKLKLKNELGSAYFKWKFDYMGDIVRLSWKTKDEKKFQEIVGSSRSSSKNFWDGLVKHFKEKGRDRLVSYYFNVYLLGRRSYQNRIGGSNIDSDDEECEVGKVRKGKVRTSLGQAATNSSPVSIFGSGKKSDLSGR